MASQADEEAGALSLVTWASVGRVAARRCLETLGGERWRSQLCRMTRAESQHDLCAADPGRPESTPRCDTLGHTAKRVKSRREGRTMAEHNDHGFMATKENAAPLKQATIDRALAMNEKSVRLPRDLNKTRARRAARLESHLPVGRQSGRRARTAPDRRRRRT